MTNKQLRLLILVAKSLKRTFRLDDEQSLSHAIEEVEEERNEELQNRYVDRG